MEDFGFEDEAEADLFVHHIASDWRKANLNAADRALCRYAEKLTKSRRKWIRPISGLYIPLASTTVPSTMRHK